MEYDVDIEKFYDYTIKECKLIVESRQRKQRNLLLQQSQMDYAHCVCMSSFLGSMMSKSHKSPEYMDIYNFLYSAEEMVEMDKKKEEAKIKKEQELLKAQWLAYANSFNARWASKGMESTNKNDKEE